ncbi:hypothetical protein [Aquimarina longa]|uniref:hypothetical protein n=1 Tax=Aquimarina longa TaxID=1080221 RepID=UPI0007854507|nr:hypothetical protein [Aquimarina longa]
MKKLHFLSTILLFFVITNDLYSQNKSVDNLYKKFPEIYNGYTFNEYNVNKDFTDILWSLKLNSGKYIYDEQHYSRNYYLISIGKSNIDTITINAGNKKKRRVLVYRNKKLEREFAYNSINKLKFSSIFFYKKNKEIQVKDYSNLKQKDSIITYLKNNKRIRTEKFINNRLIEENIYEKDKVIISKQYFKKNTYEIVEYLNDDWVIKKYFVNDKLKVYEKLNLYTSSSDNPQKISVKIEYDKYGKEIKKTHSEYAKETIFTQNSKIVRVRKNDGTIHITEYNPNGKIIKTYIQTPSQTENPEDID